MGKHREIVWSPSALADLDDITDYLAARDSVDAAIAVFLKIRSRVDSLTTLADRGRVVPELKEHGLTTHRELIAAPYRIVFRIHERQVWILGVLDGRRDLEEVLLKRSLES